MQAIFLELFDILIDRERVRSGYRAHLGAFMAARYGGEPDAWLRAHDTVTADWDSYYADLDLGGDDGIDDLWEGMFRTTRALFRLTGIPEPPKPELTALARMLPSRIAALHDALIPSARAALMDCRTRRIRLGVITGSLTSYARGALTGAGVIDQFDAPILGVDTIERFVKDRDFYERAARIAHVNPGDCLLIDVDPAAREAAASAGWQVAARLG